MLTGSPGIQSSGGGLDLKRSHQAVHPSTAARDTLSAQRLMNPRRAVGPTIPLVQLDNGPFQHLILLSMQAGRTREPSVEATAGYPEEHAKPFDAELIPVLLDKRKNQ